MSDLDPKALDLSRIESDVAFSALPWLIARSRSIRNQQNISVQFIAPLWNWQLPICLASEIGGFWLMQDQIDQLRKLPDCYPANEAPFVARAVEAYLQARRLHQSTQNCISRIMLQLK